MASIVFGMMLTALLFSTTAKVLILNRMENTVVDMLTREEWVKGYEDCAARCIVATWRWYKLRKQEYMKKMERRRSGLNVRIASLKVRTSTKVPSVVTYFAQQITHSNHDTL